MTKEEIIEMADKADAESDNVLNMTGEYHPNWHQVRDEIFAKLIAEKSKKEQDEPVAWVIHSNGEEHGLDFWQDEINALPIGTFLYTTPQTKEWVGLTNEQIVDLVIKHAGLPTKLAEAIEAKLKEKNT